LVNFSGRAADAQGKAIFGIAGVTFAIYKEQSEGAPLWMETQNVQADARGNYTIQLGTTKPEGLPLELFSSGEARWLGVRVNGGEEQPRVLLLSVPYALKAADAETVGGLPASAFVLAAPSVSMTSAAVPNPTATTASPQQPLTGTTPHWQHRSGGEAGCERDWHLSRSPEPSGDGNSECDRRHELAALQLRRFIVQQQHAESGE
jgi:hypothetical protein